MSELPKGWVETSISEITSYVQRGKGPKYSDVLNSFPVINQKAIRWFGIQEEHLKYVNPDTWGSYTEERFIKPGDILWNSTGTGTIGRACLLNEIEAAKAKVVDSHVTILRVNNAAEPRYLFYWIRSPKIQFDIESLSTGTTNQVELSKTKVLETKIPLAPLNEQKRIADKLDSILAKVDRAQARLDKIPAILKRFRQSVLSAATSGELTKDWFGDSEHYYSQLDNEISKQKKLSLIKKTNDEELNLAKKLFGDANWSRWKAYPLEALVYPERGIPYGIVQTGDAQEVGIPTIRCGDVKPLRILVDNLKKVSPEIEVKYIRTRLKGGEVLLAIRGTVGHAAVVSDDLVALKANISREVAMIPVRELINPNYIALLLQSPGGYSALTEKVRGVAQKGINLADVKRFVTPLPCFDEQSEIVNRVQALFAKADKVEKQYLESKARMDRLTQSIIAKAFRGELVPQDPNDESADKLLKKIKADNLKNKGKKK
ncbi:restriction endonuclease subunit S [Shewanella sp. SW32]|uniref:restriction endonuclease subunit S n=1 Tax=unclassified Shewanella TaxID=196818 RepID=UPI0021D82E71|nr:MULTISPECIES: restriction endonuclease subunit S [unclassified Shewanella]MCU7964237.1 restriction endonuclease subunit S [Shewanella sp. SW32]MCU7972142.1 restriction endonuclease subunit S [Shewanella sp. SW29]